MTVAFDRIFSEIIQQHQVVTAVDTAIARQLALAVIEDADAAKIIALRNALPASIEPKAPPVSVDLKRLSDSEFSQLTVLLNRASDGEVQEWSPPAEPERSARWYAAERLVEFVDKRIEEKGSHIDCALEFGERSQLLGLITGTIGDLILFDQLYRAHTREARARPVTAD